MPATALNHFEQNIARGSALVAHADPLPNPTPQQTLLRSDLFRSGWMFAVGSLDSYFCDAYTDVVAATIIAKSRHAGMNLPEFFQDISFPIRAILEYYANNTNWRWRMAARQMMQRQSVLSLATIQTLFNKFFRAGRKFFRDLFPLWIGHPNATRRLFGVRLSQFPTLTGSARADALTRIQTTFDTRFRDFFQRRHDCIHTCDRPRVKPQPIAAPVQLVIEDIAFLVRRCDEHINTEMRHFLLGTGCPAGIASSVGY